MSDPADLLRELKIPVTAQRISVLKAVTGTPHSTADTIAEIVALIEGQGDSMHLSSGAKGIVIAGYDGDAGDTAKIYLVDDSVGATAGTIEADDVVIIGTLATFDVDTLTNFNFA